MKRLWALFFLGLAVAAMVLLSAGLSKLEFLPGQPLPRSKEAEVLLAEIGLPSGSRLVDILMLALFAFAQLLLPFAVIYFILSPEARKRVIKSLGFLLWLLAIYLLLRARPDFFRQFERQPLATPSPDDVVVPAVEFVAHPPQWLVFAVTLGLALLIAALLVRAVWYVWRRRRRPGSLEGLAQEAQDALRALQTGADLKNTVMRCYFEMSRVLSEQRGIKRGAAMTPREFERYLTRAGLPGEHVRRLTRLFERVRYGAKVPGENQERQAIACLTAVVKACRSSP
jgi:hypothetical protein